MQNNLFKSTSTSTVKELRIYQNSAVEGIFDYFNEHDGAPLIVIPTGGGKSLIIADFIRQANEYFPGTTVIVVSHAAILLTQNAEELMAQYPEAKISFYSDTIGQKDLTGDAIFAGIQSIYRRAYDLRHAPDLVLVDECFVGSTIISTPDGGKRIDSLKNGDIVYNACGYGIVKSTYSSSSTHLIKLGFSDGNIIECTENHPFFTERGWREAGTLAIGEGVFCEKDLLSMQERILSLGKKRPNWQSNIRMLRGDLEKARMLFSILRKEVEKSDEFSRFSIENERDYQKNKTFSDKTRRKWEAFVSTASGIATCFRRWMAGGNCNKDECRASQWNLSKLLQSRYWERKHDDCDRNRWGISRIIRKKSARQQKEFTFATIRLESISRIERKSAEPIFNLRISGHPSYFANGVLVHNCHCISPDDGSMYRKFLEDMKTINPSVKVVGFTATPFRAGYGMLHKGKNALFTHIAYEVSILELIQLGHLCPIVTPDGGVSTKMDTAGVKTRAGDYIVSQLSKAVDNDGITKACVDEIIAHGISRNKGLIFTVDIEHCTHVFEELNVRGEKCEMIHSKMEGAACAKAIDRFKNGDVKYLVNVAMLTTGANFPSIDLLVFMRPTRSPVLYIQMAGRGMRTFPGKNDCLLLDFGNVVNELGPIDQVRVPQKGDGEGEAPMKKCEVCGAMCAAGCAKCPSCGAAFPDNGLNLDTNASNAAALSPQLKAQVVPVTRVAYYRHSKEGKPDTLRVDYLCGFETYREWVCLQHSSFPREKACAWWKQRASTNPPPDITQALQRTGELKKPIYIHVRKVGKFHEIVGADFSEPTAEEDIAWEL